MRQSFFLKVIMILLVCEGFYVFYKLTYSIIYFFIPEPLFFIVSAFYALNGLAAFLISYGLYKKGHWAAVTYMAFVVIYFIAHYLGFQTLGSIKSLFIWACNATAAIYVIRTQYLTSNFNTQ